MARVVSIIIRADGSEAIREIRAVGSALSQMDAKAARGAMSSLKSAGISDGDLKAYTAAAKTAKEAGRAFYDDQIRDARRAGAVVDKSFKEQERAVASAGKTLDRYDNQLAKLGGYDGEVRRLNKSLADPNVAKHIDDNTRSLLREKAAMIDATREANNLAKAQEKAARETSRNRQAALQGIQNGGNGARNAGQGIQTAGVAMSAAVTAPVAGFVAYVLKVGSEYETAMNIFQKATEATGAEMKRAEELAIKLGNDLTLPGVSAKDAAIAMTELGKGGLTASQAMDAVAGTLKLATAAGVEAGKAAEITSNALHMFGLNASEAGRVADLLAGAANASSAEITDVAQSLQQAGTVFNNAKIPIEDVVTLIGQLANVGIKGSDAGTSLKTMLLRLQAPTDTAADAMKALNLQVYDAAGKMKPMRQLIDEFGRSLDGLSEQGRAQALKTIFGDDAFRAAAAIFGQGAVGFDKMSEAVQRANAAQELASARTRGLAGAWEAFKSQIETFALVIYNRVKEPLTETLIVVSGFIAQLMDGFTNLSPSAQNVILVVTGIAAAIGPVLIVVGTLLVIIGSLISSFVSIGGAIAGVIGLLGGFGPALLIVVGILTTVGAAFVALGVPIAAFVAAYITDFGGIQGFTNQVWQSIQAVFQTALTAIYGLVQDVGGDVVAWWTENYPLIQQTIESVSNGIRSYLQSWFNDISAFWQNHGAEITAILQAAWNIISTVVRSGVLIILGIIKATMQAVNGDWAGAWATLNSIAQTALNALGAILANLVPLVQNAMSLIIGVLISAGQWLISEGYKIGADFVQGFVNGLKSGAGSIWTAATGIGKLALGAVAGAVDSHSPSREAMKIGGYVGEGFALGIEKKSSRVKAAAKKVADESIKQLADAQKGFDLLAGSSPERLGRLVQTSDLQEAKSGLEEILKLRRELGANEGNALPRFLPDIKGELAGLQEAKKGLAEAKSLIDSLGASIENFGKEQTNVEKINALLGDPKRNALIDEATAAILKEKAAILDAKDAAEKFAKVKTDLIKSGANEITDLVGAGKAVGVTDKVELEKIKQQTDNAKFIRENASKYNEKELNELLALKRVENERILQIVGDNQAKEQQLKISEDYSSLLEDLNGKLDENNNLTQLQITLKQLEKIGITDLTGARAQEAIAIAKEIDAQKAAIEEAKKAQEASKQLQDRLTGFFERRLSDLASGGFKGLFKGLMNEMKSFLIRAAAEWLASKFFKLLTGQTSGGSAGLGGGIFDSIKKFFGGGSGASAGGGSGSSIPGIIQNFSGGGSSGTATGMHEAAHAAAGQSGGFKFGNNVATYGAVGAGAGILGNLIGGRVGGFISGAGGGLAMGAQIGSMFMPGLRTAVGAGIGALFGGLMSLFGGDPKKKRDKKEKLPQLSAAFTDAMAQLRALGADKNAFYSDPTGTIAKAVEIRGQIAAGFGIQFESKKYQKESAAMIAGKLVEADAIIANLNKLKDRAVRASDIDSRLQTSFASGVFMSPAFAAQFSDYKRRNGMLSGAFTGRDTLPSMLATGEMVLNPTQLAAVRRNAGFDAFKGAGIPNYAGGTYVAPVSPAPSPSFSAAPNAPNILIQPKITIVIEGEGISSVRVKEVLVDSLKKDDVQIALVNAYDKGKSRNN